MHRRKKWKIRAFQGGTEPNSALNFIIANLSFRNIENTVKKDTHGA